LSGIVRGARGVAVLLVAVAPSIVLAQNGVAPDTAGSAPAVIRGQVVPRDSMTAYVYQRPRLFHAVTDVPAALGASARRTFQVRNLPVLAAIAASTVALIAADEPVLDETRRFARRVGLPPNHPSANLRIGPLKQPFPTTLGSGLYFLGDGMTSVFVASGFAIRGSVADDTRARRTASEVIESLLASGTVTQVLKHVAGRQTPSEATVPRGRWRPFAKLSDYSKNVPAYDAFPSGHLASTMATITVVALNYPEHRYIWPVGSAAMGVLSFAMVNNGVHWASDYPLALAIGGVIGHTVAARGRSVIATPAAGSDAIPTRSGRAALDLTPLVAPGVFGVRVTW
jgi:PAP2 superfamily protein